MSKATYKTQTRELILEHLARYGAINSRSARALLGRSSSHAVNTLKRGAEAGLWEEMPGAPGTYRLPSTSTNGETT